jgi:hypothetical protein
MKLDSVPPNSRILGKMPPELVKPYKPSGFNTLDERISFLFDMYQKLSMPLMPLDKPKKKRKGKT